MINTIVLRLQSNDYYIACAVTSNKPLPYLRQSKWAGFSSARRHMILSDFPQWLGYWLKMIQDYIRWGNKTIKGTDERDIWIGIGLRKVT
jgi:hypothetical protein